MPEAELPAALEWELLLLGRAAAAGSTPLLVYNTKLAAGAGRQQVEGTVPRLQVGAWGGGG